MQNKPHSEKIAVILEKIDQVVRDIKKIKIQGATNVAKEWFKILKEGIMAVKVDSKEMFFDFLKTSIYMLADARPTEPMLFNGMKYALWEYGNHKDGDLEFLMQKVADSFDYILNLVKKWDKKRSDIGAWLIKDGYKVMTHCHSGSVVKVIREAWNQGKKFEVFNTETRPLYQWRLTSKDVLDIGVPTTLVTDDTAPYFLDNTVERDVDIDMLIIGCDAIKKDGSAINKIGSFGLALSAWNSWIPVYIVGSLTKTDFEENISIELRSGKEVWADAPKYLNIVNYAFDIVPEKFINGIITRYGVMKPSEIYPLVVKNYPWMNGSLS